VSAVLVAALCLSTSAFAGDVYVNGVRADGLRDLEMTDVSVRFDASGDLWIDAPRYRVEVEAGDEAKAPPTVPAARYWLVTDDQGSSGQVVDVIVNGTLVRKIRSGEPQLILDLKPYLRPGRNTVLLNGIPTRGGSGGSLRVFVGSGRNDAGTVHLDSTDIQLRRGADDATRGESHSHTLDVR